MWEQCENGKGMHCSNKKYMNFIVRNMCDMYLYSCVNHGSIAVCIYCVNTILVSANLYDIIFIINSRWSVICL